MKNASQIKKDYMKTIDRIKANEAKIDTLSQADEIRAAIQEKDIAKYKNLCTARKENDDKIIKLSEAVYLDNIAAKILNENLKAAAVAEVLPVISEVLTKYNGKPYGEKTSEKIRTELKNRTGYYITFHGEKITIYDAAIQYNREALIYTGYNTPVITNENKIDAGALENARNRYKYAENPAAEAKKLVKLYNKARAAYEEAKEALSAYNTAAPENLYKELRNNYLPHTILTTY